MTTSRAVVLQDLTQIRVLNRDELLQVDQAVNEQLDPRSEAVKVDAFHRSLLASGLVKSIKPPVTSDDTGWEPVPVEGTPVSQTIIQERR